MAFYIPNAQYLMTTNANDKNRGTFRTAPLLNRKTGGNFPISTNAAQMQNSSGERGVYFGLDAQDGTGAIDGTTSDRVILSSWQFNAPNRIQVDTLVNRGVVFRLASGLGNSPTDFVEFSIAGNDTPQASAQAGGVTMCVSLDAGGFDTSGGTYNAGAATAWGFGTNKSSLVGSSSSLAFFQRVFLFDSAKGAAKLPKFTGVSSFDDAVTIIQGTDYNDKIGSWVTKSGSSVFLPCPFSFGDGSTATTFNDNGGSVISPSNNAAKQENFRITNDAMRVYADMRNDAADSITLSGSYNWGTPADWDFNISNASTININGATFSGMGDFRVGSSVSGAATFNLATGKVVKILNNADLKGSTINGNCDLTVNTLTTLDSLTITGILDFEVAGTYTLTNSTVGVVINRSGGAVIINNVGSTITTNTGPNITIVLPAKNISVTGIVAGSRLRVYNKTTSAQVVNEVVSGTSYTASYAEGVGYSVGDVLDLRVTKIDKLEFSSTVVVGSAGWNSLVSQDPNPVYAAHGVNGATVSGISWDSGNLQFDFNDADNKIDGADIGAWYYYFITTEVGIAEAFKALNWPQINKITNVSSIVSMTFDNTKSAPLRITNCWIDKDDGSSIIATASNSIQIDPPAVFVAQAGSSGLTPEQATELTAVKAKTDLLNFTGADIKATLDGEAVVTDTASRNASKADVSGLSTFDPAADTVANVTLVATTTTLTNGAGGATEEQVQTIVNGLNDFDPASDTVVTDTASRNASKADLNPVTAELGKVDTSLQQRNVPMFDPVRKRNYGQSGY